MEQTIETHKDTIEKEQFKAKSCQTSITACDKHVKELEREKSEQHIELYHCYSNNSRILNTLNTHKPQMQYEECKKKLRAFNSKAYSILNNCNQCFLSNINVTTPAPLQNMSSSSSTTTTTTTTIKPGYMFKLVKAK